MRLYDLAVLSSSITGPLGRRAVNIHSNQTGEARSRTLRDNSASRTISACVGNQWIETTRPSRLLSQPSQHRFDINMDHLRDSFSRLKKEAKHRFRRSKRKGDQPGPGGREDSVGSSSSYPQPESRVSTGSGREGEGDGRDTGSKNAGVSVAAVESRPGWGTTASSSAKLVLRGVRDSADAFGPLKSAVGGLCFILENYEVRYLPSWMISGLTCP